MKNSWIIGLLLFFTVGAFAQEQKEKNGEIGSKIVNRDYRPKIADAKKLGIPIQIERIRVKPPEYDYSITPTLFELEPHYFEPMQPISLGERKLEPLSSPYIVAGFGNYRNLLLDAYYSSKRSNKGAYDFNVKHRSGKAPAQYSGFGTSALGFNGEKFYKKTRLSSALDLSHNRVHHYGLFTDSIPDTIDFDRSTIRSEYFNADLDLAYDNFQDIRSKNKFKVELLPYFYFRDSTQYEWAIEAKGLLEKSISDESKLQFSADYDFNSFVQDDANLSRNIIRAEANYSLNKEDYRIVGGFKTASNNINPPSDTASTINNFHIFPHIYAHYKLVGNYLIAYAGLTGSLQKNSLRSISQENPFIANDIELKNSVENIFGYGGFKGSFTDELQFNASVSYKSVSNFLLFANLDSAQNYFQPQYAVGNTDILKVSAEMQYKQLERWLINLKGNYYQYTLINTEALNLPTLDGELSAKYNLQDKIIATANIYAFNQRIGNTVNGADSSATVLPGAVDISLGAEYNFNNKTHFFLNVNNLLHQKYMVWNRFRVQGFHLMAGLKLDL